MTRRRAARFGAIQALYQAEMTGRLHHLAYNLENGDIQKDKAPTYAQIVDETIAAEAIAKIGGPVEIGGCRL